MNKQERNRLISQISRTSGVAKYALHEKMTDEQISFLAQNLEVLKTLKPANTYNRYCQAQKTREANEKLKSFLDSQNSETLQEAGEKVNIFERRSDDPKRQLSSVSENRRERYGMECPRKKDVLRLIPQQSYATLKPCCKVFKLPLPSSRDGVDIIIGNPPFYVRE